MIKLKKVVDLGMQVNDFKTDELVDQCYVVFEVDGIEVPSYNMSKTTNANSSFGKLIKAFLGRKLCDKDYDENNLFDTDVLIGLETEDDWVKKLYPRQY